MQDEGLEVDGLSDDSHLERKPGTEADGPQQHSAPGGLRSLTLRALWVHEWRGVSGPVRLGDVTLLEPDI